MYTFMKQFALIHSICDCDMRFAAGTAFHLYGKVADVGTSTELPNYDQPQAVPR
jgi:hypothetical protein